MSRAFIQASATKLRELQERDLSGEDVVALVLDGKTFAEATMVVALGITMTGDKRFLGVVETDTENEKVLTPFLRSLVERGLDVSQGLLVIVDGGKGLRAAVRKAFRHRALVQRCQWHTRENVVSDVAKREQPVWRQRLQRAYNRPEYDEALAALQSLQHELEDRNQSAAGSLAEGLDETLTLHRLGVYGVLGRSLKTTNGLESINALIEERCAKVDHWQNSSQRHRWLATALLDIEPRLRKVMGYRHLPRLRDALTRELKIDTTTSTKKAASAIRSRGEFQLGMGLTPETPMIDESIAVCDAGVVVTVGMAWRTTGEPGDGGVWTFRVAGRWPTLGASEPAPFGDAFGTPWVTFGPCPSLSSLPSAPSAPLAATPSVAARAEGTVSAERSVLADAGFKLFPIAGSGIPPLGSSGLSPRRATRRALPLSPLDSDTSEVSASGTIAVESVGDDSDSDNSASEPSSVNC